MVGIREAVVDEPGLKVYSHLSRDKMQDILNRSRMVVSRSGYSTLMELVELGIPALFIPTPGQTEQEYLATYLKKKNIAFTCSSKSFSLTNVLQAAESFPYQIPAMSSANLLTAAIEELLHQLRVVKK